MQWYSEGDWSQPSGENGGGSSGGGSQGGGRIFRLKIFTGLDKGRDILYLDDSIFRFWEHHGKDDQGRWSPGIHGICRKRNRLGDGACPPCELGGKSMNLYNIGFLTAVDISFGVGKEYQGERRMYLCEKRLVGAKAGTTDHPGPLAHLNRIRERHGRLKGLVLHQIRNGKKSPTIGDTFEVVQQLDPTPEAMTEYLKHRIRNMIKDGTIQKACAEVGIGVPNKQFYQDKLASLSLEPYDYERIFEPMGAMELARHFNLQWTPSGGAPSGPPADQDDDPFSSTPPPPTDQKRLDYGSGRESDAQPFAGAPGPGYAEGQPDGDDQDDMPF